MGNFKAVGKYNWGITDKYGWEVSKDVLRDIRIDIVLEDSDIKIELDYNIGFRKRNHTIHDVFTIYFIPRENKLKLKSWTENDCVLNVDLICNSLEKAEELVDMIVEGNDLELNLVNRV